MSRPEEILLLATVGGAMRRMLDAIGAARSSIRCEYYIVDDSAVGASFLKALCDAASRKVRVEVMVDSWGSGSLPKDFWSPLSALGGEVHWFNPLKFGRIGIRNHRKLLVIDDTTAFTGGFNLASEYEGDGVTKGWLDAGVEVRGPLVRELAESFDEMIPVTDCGLKPFPRLRSNNLGRVRFTEQGRLFTTAPGRGPFYLRNAYMDDLARSAAADIISAYFLPTLSMRRKMVAAGRRGARVRLIMAGKSDVAMSQLACRYLYRGFFRAGIEIHEYQPQILHAKLLHFGHAVYVGSANLDKRSLFINHELMLRLEQPEVLADSAKFVEAALEKSLRIDPAAWKHSRSIWTKTREQLAFWLLSRVDPYLTRLQLAAERG